MGAVVPDPEPGGLSLEFLFQLLGIVLVLLPDLLQLSLLLGQRLGCGGLHGNVPEDPFGLFASHGGVHQSFAAQLAVRPEADDRHLQVLGAVLESVLGGRFRWQVLGEVVGQAEQILQRVVVFVAGHSPEGRVSLLGPTHGRGDLDLRGEPFDHPGAVPVTELGRVGRRHFSVVQHRDDFQPPFHVVSVQEIRIELVDANVAFLLLGSVTPDAGGFQDGLDILPELRESGFGRFGSDRLALSFPITRSPRPGDFQLVEGRECRDVLCGIGGSRISRVFGSGRIVALPGCCGTHRAQQRDQPGDLSTMRLGAVSVHCGLTWLPGTRCGAIPAVRFRGIRNISCAATNLSTPKYSYSSHRSPLAILGRKSKCWPKFPFRFRSCWRPV